MKKIILGLMLLATPTALSACSASTPERTAFDDAVARSYTVRVCRSGAKILRDPVDGNLLIRDGYYSDYIAPGVAPEAACD